MKNPIMLGLMTAIVLCIIGSFIGINITDHLAAQALSGCQVTSQADMLNNTVQDGKFVQTMSHVTVLKCGNKTRVITQPAH